MQSAHVTPDMLTVALAVIALQGPLVTITGQTSSITSPQASLVTSEMRWKALWKQHTISEEPKVDFSRCVVLAVFQGKEVQTQGYEWLDGTLEDGTLTARVRPKWYATLSNGQPQNHDSSAYAFFILPRSFQRIVLEEQVRTNSKQDPPKFKTSVDAEVD